MRKPNESGSLLLPLIIVFVLLLGAIGFASWAFIGRQDYKTNSDAKAATAAKKAADAEAAKKDAEFAEAEKSPFRTYKGPETFGSISITYPKTWSAYVNDSGKNTSTPVDGYFHPSYVPDITSDTAFALRVQVLSLPYSQVLANLDSQVKLGKIQLNAYRPPKVPSVLGSIVRGEIIAKRQQTMMILPLRDKTIKIWAEGSDYLGDFNNTIAANLTFAP